MTNSNWKVVSSAVVPIVGFVGQDFSRPLPELFIFFQPMPAEMHKTDDTGLPLPHCGPPPTESLLRLQLCSGKWP